MVNANLSQPPLPEPPAPRLSLGSWAFAFGPFASDPWSFERVCAYAADAGYDGVEINGFRPHPHFDDYAGDESYMSLRSLRDQYGLEYSAYAPDFTATPPSLAPTDDYLRAVGRSIDLCTALDIRIVRADTISPPEDLAPDEYARRFDQLVRTWTASAELCDAAGITLVWEFEPGFWLNRPSEVLSLLTTIDHPAFRVLFDTSHAYTTGVMGHRQFGVSVPETLRGGLPEYAALLQPFLGHFHLIDTDGGLHNDETSEHLPFGHGDLDFGSTLDALRPALDDLPWWTIDFCFCPTTEQHAREAIPFINALIQREHS